MQLHINRALSALRLEAARIIAAIRHRELMHIVVIAGKAVQAERDNTARLARVAAFCTAIIDSAITLANARSLWKRATRKVCTVVWMRCEARRIADRNCMCESIVHDLVRRSLVVERWRNAYKKLRVVMVHSFAQQCVLGTVDAALAIARMRAQGAARMSIDAAVERATRKANTVVWMRLEARRIAERNRMYESLVQDRVRRGNVVARWRNAYKKVRDATVRSFAQRCVLGTLDAAMAIATMRARGAARMAIDAAVSAAVVIAAAREAEQRKRLALSRLEMVEQRRIARLVRRGANAIDARTVAHANDPNLGATAKTAAVSMDVSSWRDESSSGSSLT